MQHRKFLFRLCCALLVLSLLPMSVLAESPPSQAGARKLEGGQRDFSWPMPGYYNISSCFLDGRSHYALDIPAPMGINVIASYPGKVIDIYTGCSHNWSKTGNCCISWGNYVLLEHSYTLKNGSVITLYSRYAHLSKVSVKVGQSVARGEKIGTNGSTGRSSGSHLHYEILYGGTFPSKTYSVDPYINELLELPEELNSTFGNCCKKYVAYVKQWYPRCTHNQYNSEGACTDCGYVYDWKATQDISAMGNYTASADTQAFSIPYSQSSGTLLTAGQTVQVKATVMNGPGETWYEMTLEDGTTVYTPKSALTLQSYFASQINLEDCTVKDGMTLQQKAYRLDGKITSVYPIRSMVGYLDGKQYASWSGSGGVREVSLSTTALNNKLSFAKMTPGEHTLSIFVTDSTGREPIQVYQCTFTIEKLVVIFTVTYLAEPENIVKTLEAGQPLGELPTLIQEGMDFVGWYTEDDQRVTAETIPTTNMTLQPKWAELVIPEEPQETESVQPTEPEISEPPTQPETEPTAKESIPEQGAEKKSYLWVIPVVLVILGGAVGVFFWVKKKKQEKVLL